MGQEEDPVGVVVQSLPDPEEVVRHLLGPKEEAAVRQLDEMTQHNAALVEETNAAIEQTEAQATELDRVVDIFTLDHPAAATPPTSARSITPTTGTPAVTPPSPTS